METRPTMHCHSELDLAVREQGYLSDEQIFNWHLDRYSTSKHLLTLYSLAHGLGAERIFEVGFGRSSFVLAKVAHQNHGIFFTVDTRDFSYLLTEEEKETTTFLNMTSDKAFDVLNQDPQGFAFGFLDYFSGEDISTSFCLTEILKFLKLLRQNGVLAIHDTHDTRYKARFAIQILKLHPGLEVITLPYNYGLTLIRKKSQSRYGKINDTFKKKPESNN